mgnify:CR=1 FL=1|tara:strand:+ start:7296 stop:8111 length:816 start_codon:yes stop_codon:yes gene_type:complete
MVKLNNFIINNQMPFTAILGPCQIESKAHAEECNAAIKEICDELDINYIFKSSFDKANRSSILGKRGIGMYKGLNIMSDIRESGTPTLTDVHETDQVKDVAQAVDVLQIPAFLCRQTDLLVACGRTGKIVNVKKGQFLAPWEMQNVADKIASTRNKNIILTDRGTSFGYNTLVSDMRGIPIMKKTGYPVCIDATHSVQQPGGQGTSSGGQREFVPTIATAAVSLGVAAVFIETHPDPDNAPSDGPNMIPIKNLKSLLAGLIMFDNVAKKIH